MTQVDSGIDLVLNGLIITGVGFGAVCGFLIMIVFCIGAMTKVIQKYFPQEEIAKANETSRTSSKEIEIAIAIAMAKAKQ